MNDIQEFVALLFLSREYAHREHLNATSYAEHMALGSFYEEIIPLADAYAEALQGTLQVLIGDIPYLDIKKKKNALETLTTHLETIRKMKDLVCLEDETLENLVDEIIALYLSTLYKLKFLK
jgi:hypothetical protein